MTGNPKARRVISLDCGLGAELDNVGADPDKLVRASPIPSVPNWRRDLTGNVHPAGSI